MGENSSSIRSTVRHRLLSGIAVMAVVAGGLLAAPLSAQAAAPVSVATAVAEILADTNALRAAGGLAPLTESTQVDTVAQNWSAQMSANGAMSHNPSYSTQIPAGWTAAGENVATGYAYTAVVEAWHQSAGHYANIMGNYNTIGIGYYDLGGQTYFTQDFGNYSTVPSPAGGPFGSFDGAAMTGMGQATVSGWAIDPDTTSSITTRLYVDGAYKSDITASNSRPDLATVFPTYGANHGWSATVSLSGGTHSICAYGMNTGPGSNTTLGCRTVIIPTGSPFGSFDVAAMTALGVATISGWDIDPDTGSAIQTHIYVDGVFNTVLNSSTTRTDLSAAFPAYAPSNGWSATIALSAGTHSVCAYGINKGPGANTTLGCRTVTIPTGSPFGSFDGATMTAAGVATVSGWVIDPDTASAITTRLYVDGAFQSDITSPTSRPDLTAVYPAYGSNHGWSATLTVGGGTHTICAYGLNSGPGSNSTLGCRTVSTGAAAPQPGTTGQMPTGTQTIGGQTFTPTMSEDFTRSAALGSFTSVYGTAWAGYNNVKDTSGHGLYSPDQVLSVQNSTLDWYLHTVNGQPLVAAPMPTGYTGQAYGAYSVRYRTDSVKGYKTAFLLWPTSNQWADGEIDWPDGNLASTIYPASKIVGDPNGAFDKPAQRTAPNEGTGWHVATVTWTPGLVQFYLDGAMIGQTSNAGGVPTKAMRWVLQVETSLDGSTPAASASGHVQVDWVVQYRQGS